MSESPMGGGDPVLVLFRRDLRIADNRALAAAAGTGRPVLAAFVHEDSGARPPGAASRWWLHHSLVRLRHGLAGLGAPLVLRRGGMEAVADLVRQSGARAIYWNRRYDPGGIAADAAMKQLLREDGCEAESFDGCLLHEPSRLKTGAGGPYRVYSPFWKALSSGPEPRDPIDAPQALTGFSGDIASETPDDLFPLPRSPDWAAGFRHCWTPGEAGAHAQLAVFLKQGIGDYASGRDRPASGAVSRLSPHLAHGEITPFQILAALRDRGDGASAADVLTFRKELGWREFCHHLLFHFPELPTRNFRRDFDAFPWRDDPGALRAWRRGMTGYPIVDAGMRELWRTGYMHNRVRMIAASFLCKHLLTDWRAGEAWFWDTLLDADPANNPANWQWVAGSGADAAPYFRIFNPVLQGEKFDPRGDYVRRWVPELAAMPDKYLHKPWAASHRALEKAGVTLGQTYPAPIVEHHRARDRALAAFRAAQGRA